MSLTGALEAFPLPEVLQLLSRSEKSGALRVRGGGLEAKVYLAEGACTYASTRSDDNFNADLVHAGLVEDADWRKIERHEATLADHLVEGRTEDDLTEFVAERVYEVLYQLLRLERGTFEFVPGVEPRIPTGVKHPVDLCLEQARSRLTEWKDIESVIPDMRLRLVMDPDPDRDEVMLDRETWQVLAGMSGATSVMDAAERLGWTDYQAAKAMAGLVRDGLIRLLDGAEAESPTEDAEDEPTRAVSLVGGDPESEEPGEEAVGDQPSDEEEADFLRVALSEVVNPADRQAEGEEPEAGSDEGDAQKPLMRRRGLGAISREWRDE